MYPNHRNNNLFPQLHFLKEEQRQQTSNFPRQTQPSSRLPQHHQSQINLNQNQQKVLSATQPLPTHHPLQLLQWNHHDQMQNSWQLDKYNRLNDTRKQPMTIERGFNDRLVLQFKDEQSKSICIYHNYNELEAFCIHPILFSHDLVSKESKLLFCIKDQIDGSIRCKFRVKFPSAEMLHSFCSAVAGYVTIKTYEEWAPRNNISGNSSDLMNLSICSDHSTISDLSSTAGNSSRAKLFPSQALKELNGKRQQIDDGIIEIADYRLGKRISSPRLSPVPSHSRSKEDLIGKKNDRIKNPLLVDASTQTDENEFGNEKSKNNKADNVGMEHQQRTNSTNGINLTSKSDSSRLINVNISNLISVEAVHELGQILMDSINLAMQNNKQQPMPIPKTKSNNKKKQQTPPPIQEVIEQQNQDGISNTQFNHKRESPPGRKMLLQTPPTAQFDNGPVLMVPETPQQENNVVIVQMPHIATRETSKKARKRHVSVTPSIWKICEEKERLKELMKCEKKKAARKHRRSSSQHYNYNLRGCCPNPDFNDVSLDSTINNESAFF